MQLSLAAFGLAGLLVKRAKETPCRPWRIWSMDVGKQALGRYAVPCGVVSIEQAVVLCRAGSADLIKFFPFFFSTHSLYAHFVNMLLAMGLSTLAGGGLDECAWYAVNYLTDSTL